MKSNKEQLNEFFVKFYDFMIWKGTHSFYGRVCFGTCALEKLNRKQSENNEKFSQFHLFEIYLEWVA